ncbi:hypothetical protein, partial [Burkholderia vietnamiensis]|uniref:hypothetical protein n=1 Tax=Burkholderia vietnamiensis TaxID=60552 RepID=UPI00352CBFDA
EQRYLQDNFYGQTTVPSGAAVELDPTKLSPAQQQAVAAQAQSVNVMGVQVPKVVAYVGGGVLLLMVLKKAGLL